jgi:hypothetical protein
MRAAGRRDKSVRAGRAGGGGKFKCPAVASPNDLSVVGASMYSLAHAVAVSCALGTGASIPGFAHKGEANFELSLLGLRCGITCMHMSDPDQHQHQRVQPLVWVTCYIYIHHMQLMNCIMRAASANQLAATAAAARSSPTRTSLTPSAVRRANRVGEPGAVVPVLPRSSTHSCSCAGSMVGRLNSVASSAGYVGVMPEHMSAGVCHCVGSIS